MGFASPVQIEFILNCALFAPSADNFHLFSFNLEEDRIQLVGPQDEPISLLGYRGLLNLLSLGAVAENLILAGTRFGMEFQMEILESKPPQPIVINFNLTKNSMKPDPLLNEILRRHTNRRFGYRGPKLDAQELSHYQQKIRNLPEVSLSWIDEPEQRAQILPLIFKGERARLENKTLHAEIVSGLDFSLGWEDTCEEGIPLGALEIEKPMRPMIRLIRFWPILRFLNWFGVSNMMAFKLAYLPCRLAPNLGLISIREPTLESVLSAGRAFQRVWLTATSQGRVIQPILAAPMYARPGASEQGVPPSLQEYLQVKWKEILGEEKTPMIIFRLGFADHPSVVTSRKSYVHYLVKKLDR